MGFRDERSRALFVRARLECDERPQRHSRHPDLAVHRSEVAFSIVCVADHRDLVLRREE